MGNDRILTPKELSFIKRNLKNTKTQLFWLLLIVVLIVGFIAIAIYTTETSVHFFINIMFGVLILLIGVLHWIFKGYKQHQLNPIVYQGVGYYERIYEQRGKYGAYYDTLNGVKIKLPWHWRRYLKQQKAQVTYEYIIRDGPVAFNEHAMYIVAINNVLSLDYELKNGLQNIKPLSLLNFVSLFIILPTVLIMSFGRNLEDALHIAHVFKTPEKHSVQLNNGEELQTISTSNYIKIDSAWVYQYKRIADIYGENYILSKAERDRIYNHPSANMDYRFFVPSTYVTKPDKAKLKEALKNNPLSKNTIFNTTDSTILNKVIEKAYKTQLQTYNQRVSRLKNIEKQLQELQPKTFILKIYDDVFTAPKTSLFSIKKSLERPYTVKGFYNVETKRLLSIENQETRKKDIKNAFILMSICIVICVVALLSLIKIVRNSLLKIKLAKAQIESNNLKQLP